MEITPYGENELGRIEEDEGRMIMMKIQRLQQLCYDLENWVYFGSEDSEYSVGVAVVVGKMKAILESD